MTSESTYHSIVIVIFYFFWTLFNSVCEYKYRLGIARNNDTIFRISLCKDFTDYIRKHGYFIIYLEMHNINYSLCLEPILYLPLSSVSTHTLVWYICKLIFKEQTHISQNKRIIIFSTLILQLLPLVLSVVLRPHGLSPSTLSWLLLLFFILYSGSRVCNNLWV